MALNQDRGGAPREPDRDPMLDGVYALSPRDEPPARLDDAIRAAARREVHAGPRSLRAGLRSWRMPVSIAAILVLSASLVTLMKDEGVDRPYEGPAPESPRIEQLYTPPPAAKPEPREEPGRPATAPQAAAPSDRAQKEDVGRRRNDMAQQVESVLERVQPSVIPPAGEVPRLQEGGAMREAERTAVPEEAKTAGRGAPFAAAPPAKPGATRDDLAKKADPGARSEDSAAQSGATVAQEAGKAARQGPEADVRASPERRELRSAPAARPEAGATASLSRAPIWSGFERQPPEKWVERIEELRRAGREAEAREMQEEFRKRFPDYPPPAR